MNTPMTDDALIQQQRDLKERIAKMRRKIDEQLAEATARAYTHSQLWLIEETAAKHSRSLEVSLREINRKAPDLNEKRFAHVRRAICG